MTEKRLYRVMWQQAEYPNENGEQVLALTDDEAAKLKKMGETAEEDEHIVDFELLPSTPLDLETFLDLFGYDFVSDDDPS